MSSLSFEALDASDATRYTDQLVELYGVVYSRPPYEERPEQVAEFATKLPAEIDREGFSLVVATDDSRLVGAAYGWTMPAGRWWLRADGEPPEWLRDAPKLAIMEWIVAPDRRREGIGARLITRLLCDRPEPWATLAADPRSAARAMYERAGWRKMGASKLPWGPTMDLLVLPLKPLRPPT